MRMAKRPTTQNLERNIGASTQSDQPAFKLKVSSRRLQSDHNVVPHGWNLAVENIMIGAHFGRRHAEMGECLLKKLDSKIIRPAKN